MGRSDRLDPNATLVGAFITTNCFDDIDAVRKGCEYEEKNQKLYNCDYLKILKHLEMLKPETDA